MATKLTFNQGIDLLNKAFERKRSFPQLRVGQAMVQLMGGFDPAYENALIGVYDTGSTPYYDDARIPDFLKLVVDNDNDQVDLLIDMYNKMSGK